MVLGCKLRHIIKDSRPQKVRISDSLPVRKNNLYNQIFIHQGSFFSLNVNRKIEKNYLCHRNFTCQIWEITQCKSIKTIFIDSNFLLHQNLHPYLLSTSTTLWVYIPYKVSCLEGLHITSTVDHSSRTCRSISVVLCASKGLDFGVLVHIPISQNNYLQRYDLPLRPLLLVPPTKTCHGSRMRQSILVVFGMSKRLDFSVLVHIPISQNNQVLTDMVPIRCVTGGHKPVTCTTRHINPYRFVNPWHSLVVVDGTGE